MMFRECWMICNNDLMITQSHDIVLRVPLCERIKMVFTGAFHLHAEFSKWPEDSFKIINKSVKSVRATKSSSLQAKGMNGITFINDQLPIICNIAREIKPDIACDVQYRDDIEGAGCTTFPDDPGERILIDINANIPFAAVAEILAHELSHVIVGKTKGDGHTPEWERTFQEIFDRYEARISEGKRHASHIKQTITPRKSASGENKQNWHNCDHMSGGGGN